MSVFLMGCYDEDRDNWVTVTKVRNKVHINVRLTPTKFKIRFDAGTHWSRRCNFGKPSG